MENRPYLKVKEIEVIIRVDLVSMQQIIKDGHYDLQVDNDWIKVYVTLSRINTSGKPLQRMEISSSDCHINQLLRVYRRIIDHVELQLRDSLGLMYDVEYCSVHKLNLFYMTGEFLASEIKDMFTYQYMLMDGTKLMGCSMELKRAEQRWVYLDMENSTFKECCKLLEAVEGREVLLEEIL
jgi:hypothetical protein